MHRRFVSAALALGLAASVLASGPARADTFPDQPLRLVIPYPPGGALSVLGAIVTTVAEPHLGQPMVQLVRAGGGGAVGATFVAQAKPDGYTLLLGEPTINTLRPQVEKLPYAPEDFVPIARLTQTPFVFVASANAPFGDLKGMVEYAKANPDKLVYSSDNVNGWTYTAFEMLKKATGTKMRGVEFGGGGPAVTNVLGGNTMAYAGDPTILADHVKQGRLKAICTTGDKRFSLLPDVPTCKEQGVDVNWGAWIGVFAPAKTPAANVEKLRKSLGALVKDEGFLRLVARINTEISYLDAPEFDAALKAESTTLRDLYASLKAK